MSSAPTHIARNRLAPPVSGSALIVLIVPLAATCLFGIPLGTAFARQALAGSNARVEFLSPAPDRAKRAVESERHEGGGDDPPARVCRSVPSLDTDVCAAHVVARLRHDGTAAEAWLAWREHVVAVGDQPVTGAVALRGPPAA